MNTTTETSWEIVVFTGKDDLLDRLVEDVKIIESENA